MTRQNRTRRGFLGATAVCGAIAFAGCSSPGPSGESGNESDTGSGDGGSDDGGSGDHDGGAGDHDGGAGDHEGGSGDDGGHHGSGASLDGPTGSASVSMVTTDEGSHFQPHVVWVETGGTVTWTLESGSHSTTAYAEQNGTPARIPADGAPWDTGTISSSSETFKQRFDAAGVYDYFCRPHEANGMVGTVIVGEPSSDGQPGLTKPENGIPEAASSRLQTLNERVRSALEGDRDGDADGDGHH